jgi:hypothetical protein
MGTLEFRSHSLIPVCRFANHRDSAHNSVLSELIVLQCIEASHSPRVLDCPFDRFGHVLEVVPDTFRMGHNGSA